MPTDNTDRLRGKSSIERISKGPKVLADRPGRTVMLNPPPGRGPVILKTPCHFWKKKEERQRVGNVQFKPSESTQPKIHTFATQQQCSVGTDQNLGLQTICRGYIARLHGIQSKSVRTFSRTFSTFSKTNFLPTPNPFGQRLTLLANASPFSSVTAMLISMNCWKGCRGFSG